MWCCVPASAAFVWRIGALMASSVSGSRARSWAEELVDRASVGPDRVRLASGDVQTRVVTNELARELARRWHGRGGDPAMLEAALAVPAVPAVPGVLGGEGDVGEPGGVVLAVVGTVVVGDHERTARAHRRAPPELVGAGLSALSVTTGNCRGSIVVPEKDAPLLVEALYTISLLHPPSFTPV